MSRELARNATPAYKLYLSHRAHERAVIRKKESGVRPRLKDERIISYVRTKLSEDWSPELIAGRISQEIRGATASVRRKESAERSVKQRFPTVFR